VGFVAGRRRLLPAAVDFAVVGQISEMPMVAKCFLAAELIANPNLWWSLRFPSFLAVAVAVVVVVAGVADDDDDDDDDKL